MFNKNNLNIGIGLGLIVPMLFFGIFQGIVALGVPLKLRTYALVGVCLNILIMRAFRKNYARESVRGVVLSTFALCFLWFLWYYKEISEEWGF